jgi:hypothetical protein
MSIIDLSKTSCGDICTAAIKECGGIGVGQTPLAEDITDAQARLNWMLAQWARKRWMIYHLLDLSVTSTGAATYTIGPGGDIDTGPGSVRPNRLENGNFLRQLTQSQPNQIDYPLELLESMEDFSRIALKRLVSFPQYIFLDPQWPIGVIHVYPVAQANIYAIHACVREQIQTFTNLATLFEIPYEYYWAMVTNLALRLRGKYQIPSFPGDTLPAQAKDSLNVIKGGNTAIARLRTPRELVRNGIYNVFSDQFY